MPVGAIKDGDAGFVGTLDSASDPMVLQPGSFAWSINMLNRDGIPHARPGYDWAFTLPSGILQGITYFLSSTGNPVIVAFVSGVCYASAYPYKTFREVTGTTMSATASRVYTARAVQSATANPDGSITLIPPRNLLIVQDGVNPPAYFDGNTLTPITGTSVTPQGTHMAWVGSRLWVARGNRIFASDISNPLSFVEQTYNTLGGVNYFLLSDNCTGLAPVPGAPINLTSLFAFTDNDTTTFQANILNRSLWPSTPNFQYTTFPSLGCVSSRSIVSISAELWWFSSMGLTRLDAAQASQLSTRIYRLDNEMIRSSHKLKRDLSGVACVAYENLVLTSVPYASKWNKHTWVYDGTVDERLSESATVLTNTPPVWASVWTGVQPVEWTTFMVDSRPFVFCASVDHDGNNRVYKAFSTEQRDNGCDFPWAFETRAYTGGAIGRKHLRFLEYSLSELQGEVNLNIFWAGVSRGRWKSVATPTFYAQEGNIDTNRSYLPSDVLYALKKQSRIARTQDVRDLPEDKYSSAGVEGIVEYVEDDKEAIDVAFQFRITGSGPCAIRSLRVFMDQVNDADSGQAVKAEVEGTHMVRFDGAATTGLPATVSSTPPNLDTAPDVYPATMSAEAFWNNFGGQQSATINGTISQDESNKRAAQVALARANYLMTAEAQPYTRTFTQ